MNLSTNHFRGRIAFELRRIVNLDTLDLSSNKFSGQVPSSVRASSYLVAAKGVVLKRSDVVIDIPDQDDEDDIFGDDQLFDKDVGGQKEPEVYVEIAVVTPVVHRAGSCQGSGARCAKSQAGGGAVEEGRR
ncbi:hypothetical protein C5167_034111 [Papaver somniferum]|uniref:Uncharacterized protein n=1 Tax=Papaver somniferum TaxID=3469 RepID=A0A4Y7KFX0_PAPSO|nr:hypothetical protein C5167_034111 [Papaver somniferum]